MLITGITKKYSLNIINCIQLKLYTLIYALILGSKLNIVEWPQTYSFSSSFQRYLTRIKDILKSLYTIQDKQQMIFKV